MNDEEDILEMGMKWKVFCKVSIYVSQKSFHVVDSSKVYSH
jgi:hypothetical protein